MSTQRKRVGFTIVELIIAVTVIGILASVTVVGYRGVQERGRAASTSAALKDASGKLKLAKFDNSGYPLTGSLATAGITDGNGIKYQYTSDGSTYCLTATDKNVSYKIEPETTPAAGACTGHLANGDPGITNLILNPSAELGLTNYGTTNGATSARSTTRARNGTYSVLVTLPAIGPNLSGFNLSTSFNIGTRLDANTTYMISAWVYVPSATVDVALNSLGGGVATGCTAASRVATVKDAWARISCPITTSSSGGVTMSIVNYAASTAGMQFFADSIMATQGSTLNNYVDPTTNSNWVWTTPASPHNSNSNGPPV